MTSGDWLRDSRKTIRGLVSIILAGSILVAQLKLISIWIHGQSIDLWVLLMLISVIQLVFIAMGIYHAVDLIYGEKKKQT